MYAHMKLSFNNMILTVSDTEGECHANARFWMPVDNEARLLAYMKMAKIQNVSCKIHFGRLVNAGIVKVLKHGRRN